MSYLNDKYREELLSLVAQKLYYASITEHCELLLACRHGFQKRLSMRCEATGSLNSTTVDL